jgi:hypothetical protein
MTKIIFDAINEIYNTKLVDEKIHMRDYIDKISKQIINDYQLHPIDPFYENIKKIYKELRGIQHQNTIKRLISDVFKNSANLYNIVINREKDSPIFKIILNNENKYLSFIDNNMNIENILDRAESFIKRYSENKFKQGVNSDGSEQYILAIGAQSELARLFEKIKQVGVERETQYSPVGFNKTDDYKQSLEITDSDDSEGKLRIPQSNPKYNPKAKRLYDIFMRYVDQYPILKSVYESRLNDFISNKNNLPSMPKSTNTIPTALDNELNSRGYSYGTVEYLVDDIILITQGKKHIEILYHKSNSDMITLPKFQHDWLEVVMDDDEFKNYIEQGYSKLNDTRYNMLRDKDKHKDEIESKHHMNIGDEIDPVFGLPIIPSDNVVFEKYKYSKIQFNKKNEHLLTILQQYVGDNLKKILNLLGYDIPKHPSYNTHEIIDIINKADSSSKIIYICFILDFYYKTFKIDEIKIDMSYQKNSDDPNVYKIKDDTDLNNLELETDYNTIHDIYHSQDDIDKIKAIYDNLMNILNIQHISEKKLVSDFNITEAGKLVGTFYYKTYPIRMIKQSSEVVFRLPKFFNESSLDKLINNNILEISGWYQYTLYTNIKNELDEISFERTVVYMNGDYTTDELLFYEAVESLSNWRRILQDLHDESLRLNPSLTGKFQLAL